MSRRFCGERFSSANPFSRMAAFCGSDWRTSATISSNVAASLYDRTGRTVKQILAGSAALPNGREWPIDRGELIERGE